MLLSGYVMFDKIEGLRVKSYTLIRSHWHEVSPLTRLLRFLGYFSKHHVTRRLLTLQCGSLI
jgi:hypothetical protein